MASSKVCGEETKARGTLSSYFGALRDIKDMRKQRKGADEAARLLEANPSRWIETYYLQYSRSRIHFTCSRKL